MEAVDNRPCAIGINASGFRFSTYNSGVLTKCTNSSMNHAVVLDGYDSTADEPYWRVRNSWGTGWGEDGYILIGMDGDANNGKGPCGINQDVDYPTAGKAW